MVVVVAAAALVVVVVAAAVVLATGLVLAGVVVVTILAQCVAGAVTALFIVPHAFMRGRQIFSQILIKEGMMKTGLSPPPGFSNKTQSSSCICCGQHRLRSTHINSPAVACRISSEASL